MGQFNPFYRSNNGGGSGGGGSSEVVRYKIEKSLENSKTVFKLKQSINGVSSYVGNIITFDAADISFDSEKAQTVEEALNYLLNFTEGNYNFTTFQELGIDTSGKTMEQILSEVLSKNLPVNTIITGQIYKSAAPDLGWNNAEAKIQITEGGVGQQIYWCSVSSIEVEPYQWNSIYYEKQSDGSIQETLGWTPTYYELPTASKNEKGGILVGDTLTIDSNGVLNINLSNIKSIEKIEFTSSTEGVLPAIEGATDTYTIYYTDGTTFTYQIQNGVKGTNGENGITPKFNVTDTAIQVSTDNGATYLDLVLLSEITGAAGADGENGQDGITPILRATETAIQVSIDNGGTYTDLVQISDITGEDGQDGISVTGALINSNGHLIVTLSNGNEIDAGEAKGKDGTSINIKDSLSSTDELPSTGQSTGDSYLISGNIWIYTGSTDEGSINGFKNAGNIQGPEGRGISSIVIEDGELKITYTDGTSSIVGNVVGPQGEQGIQGEKGEQGIQGENGLSAYEIFIKNNPGSTLTESEWLASLKGEKGDIGETGNDGTSISITSTEKLEGTTTITFSDGTSITINDGEKGENGLNGENGKSLEFDWNGTELGIRLEGETDYTYVDLKGEVGKDGIGISGIEFTSSTGGGTPGIAGATDTYTITLTDNTTYTFVVYNGNNGGDGHTHENKDVLDKLGEQNGELTYNGEEVFRVWHGTKQEYDALSEKSEDWTYIITDDESSVSEFTSELKEKLDGIEEGANNYVHPDVSGTKTQYGEISVNDFTISISNAPFKFGDLANASQCGVPIENAKGEHSLCANSFTSTSECAESSSAFGYATKAGAKQQFVAGRYNAVDEGDIDRTDELYGIGQYVFILGNGLSPDKLSNALAVDWKGNIFCDGDETSLNAQIDANTEKFGDYLPLTGGTLTGQLKGPMFVGDLTGNADTATKLATARTINGASFDGTTNIKVPLLNCYAYDDSSTFSDTPWHKVASTSITGIKVDSVLIMHVDKGMSNSGFNGVLRARIRSSDTAGKCESASLIWEVAADHFMTEESDSMKNSNFVLVYTEDTTNGKLTAELWVKITSQYYGYQFNVISMGDRKTATNATLWTLYNSSSGVASHTSGTSAITSSCQPIANPAAALYDNNETMTHISTSTVNTSIDSYFRGFVGMSENPAARTLYTYSTEAVKSELGITDSSWKNLILGETGQIVYRKIGSLVEIKGQYKPATSGGGFTIGTMPEGYRPSTYKAVSTLANEANNMLFLMRVRTNGEVNISGSNATTFTAGTVYDLHIQYFVD